MKLTYINFHKHNINLLCPFCNGATRASFKSTGTCPNSRDLLLLKVGINKNQLLSILLLYFVVLDNNYYKKLKK